MQQTNAENNFIKKLAKVRRDDEQVDDEDMKKVNPKSGLRRSDKTTNSLMTRT